MARKPRNTSVRLFVGIKFGLLQQIKPISVELDKLTKDESSKLRIVPNRNLHITLKFLGPTTQDQLLSVYSVLSQIAAQHRPLSLECTGIGFFRNSIWLGIGHHEELTAIASELDEAFSFLGFNRESKAFTPHLTVARFQPDAKIKLSSLQEKFANKKWGLVKLEKISLYKSDTRPEGARYHILKSFPLNGVD